MKKYLVTLGLLGPLTFLCLFFYFYKTTGKFRQSIIAAFAAATVYFSGLTPAHSAGEADAAFTQQNQQHLSRPQKREGIFNRKSNNDGSGPGKPDDSGYDSGGDGMPQFPQTESVEQTKNRIQRIEELMLQFDELTSDSESECDYEEPYGPSSTQASTFTNTDGIVNLELGYREVIRRARFSPDFECSFDRFIGLASENGETTPGTMRAAISALQLEADGVVSNTRRDLVAEANRVKAFDFLADGPNGETHLEIKGPVGSEIRKAAGLGPSIPKQGKKIGFKIRNQLNYWFNPNTDKSGVTQPESRNKVLVVNDLFDVPSAEKAQMESSINFGLKEEHPILFINNEKNR